MKSFGFAFFLATVFLTTPHINAAEARNVGGWLLPKDPTSTFDLDEGFTLAGKESMFHCDDFARTMQEIIQR